MEQSAQVAQEMEVTAIILRACANCKSPTRLAPDQEHTVCPACYTVGHAEDQGVVAYWNKSFTKRLRHERIKAVEKQLEKLKEKQVR